MFDDEFSMTEEFRITPEGLQHLFDRASLRVSVAEHDGDEDEAYVAFIEVLAISQLTRAYGWEMCNGMVIGDDLPVEYN